MPPDMAELRTKLRVRHIGSNDSDEEKKEKNKDNESDGNMSDSRDSFVREYNNRMKRRSSKKRKKQK